MTARLSFETPARLSLAVLERLTLRAVYHGPQHHGTPVQRSECHTTPAKMHLIDQLRRRAVIMPFNSEEQAFSAQAICLLDQAATLSDSSQQTTNRARARSCERNYNTPIEDQWATTTMHKCCSRAEGQGQAPLERG